ncbi:hypothetical protein ACQP2U_23850 [Nocardia sp. CA-084685]|uniref:hypothetical protein n=1 Tax=Nocardia sp. CA-084685 TaxID=3239970 RepID=UPI003D97D737
MRPKVVWALDFQFDSTVDGRAVKLASKIDEHTHESLPHLVKRSITAERLVARLEKAFHRAWRAAAGAVHGQRPEMVSAAVQQFCADSVGIVYLPPERHGTTALSSRSTGGYARMLEP